MRHVKLVILMVSACILSRVGVVAVLADAAPATRPVAAPTTQLGDLSTPRTMMLTYDAQSGAGPEAFVPFFVTHNADEERLVRAEARIDAMLGMLQVMVEKKWGASAVNTVLHAFDSKTRDDIKSAKVSVTGDVALMMWPDRAPPLQIVRTAQGWKIDAAAMTKSIGVSVDEYIKDLQTMSPVVSDIADAIAEGKLATPAAAAAETQRRIAALH
jgi:hypothetical protein